MTSNKNLEKSEVREYFNGTGFDRWRKIYSKSEEINTKLGYTSAEEVIHRDNLVLS